jgi:hypothetical protein
MAYSFFLKFKAVANTAKSKTRLTARGKPRHLWIENVGKSHEKRNIDIDFSP